MLQQFLVELAAAAGGVLVAILTRRWPADGRLAGVFALGPVAGVGAAFVFC